MIITNLNECAQLETVELPEGNDSNVFAFFHSATTQTALSSKKTPRTEKLHAGCITDNTFLKR